MPKKKTSTHKKPDVSLKLALVLVGSFLLLTVSISLYIARGEQTDCANSISCISDLSGQKGADNEGVFMGRLVTAPHTRDSQFYALEETRAVLGETTNDNKHIYVDLSKQRLYAYEGNSLIYDFPVSTGKWGTTPTGDFRIWIWLRYTRMAGGNRALGTYYNLPNVPYTMYFWNAQIPKTRGYALHGAYWHNNFGHPMSHGCVNMKPEDSGKIFYWTNPNVKSVAYTDEANPSPLITIYGVSPKE